MNYKAELDFLLSFFKNYHLNVCIFAHDSDVTDCDFGLRQKLQLNHDYQMLRTFLTESIQSNCIYKFTDSFSCIYHILQLPDYNPSSSLIIGPYMDQQPTQKDLVDFMKRSDIPPQFFKTIQDFLYMVPIVKDSTFIQNILQTFGEKIWGSSENFHFKIIDYKMQEVLPSLNWSFHIPPQESNAFDLHAIETYFSRENELINAVKQGNPEKADAALTSLNPVYLAQHAEDTLPYFKLQSTAINTLLRKVAELNAVGVYQISSLSSSYAEKIEHVISPEACIRLQHEMVRKYCLAIQNNSAKTYSRLVQDIIKIIDADLTANLSLNSLAEKMNVNASYLSNHFRKSTGSTLTEYVNKKRIEHALFLLNTTDLQIQAVSQYCGISDVNYFTKLFKKYVHKSPSDYKKEIQRK